MRWVSESLHHVLLTNLQDDDAGEPAGSEYMASSIVRGCPDECLSVLVDLSSNTTILGPASRIELLEDGEERQVGRAWQSGGQDLGAWQGRRC